MSWNDFSVFVSDGGVLLPENGKILPIASLTCPFYTLWMINTTEADQIRRAYDTFN